jgi:hypothetical protein
MPRKMARFVARPPFGLSEVRVAVGTPRLPCREAEKRQYSRQFGSHLGNPGLSRARLCPASQEMNAPGRLISHSS